LEWRVERSGDHQDLGLLGMMNCLTMVEDAAVRMVEVMVDIVW
jgi:hypothetical protein